MPRLKTPQTQNEKIWNMFLRIYEQNTEEGVSHSQLLQNASSAGWKGQSLNDWLQDAIKNGIIQCYMLKTGKTFYLFTKKFLLYRAEVLSELSPQMQNRISLQFDLAIAFTEENKKEKREENE